MVRVEKVRSIMKWVNSSWSVVTLRFIAAGLSFLFMILVARLLGVDGFGQFTIVLALVNVGVVLSLLGQEALATRVIAGGGHDKRKLFTYIRSARRQVTIASIIVIAGFFLFSPLFPIGKRIKDPWLWYVLFLVPLVSRTRLSQGFIRGSHQAGMAILPDGVLRPGIAVFVMSIMLVEGFWSVPLTVSVLLCSSVFAMIFGMIWESRTLQWKVKNKFECDRTQGSFSCFSWQIYLASILAVLISQMGILATGMFSNAEQAGLYAAAERFSLASALMGQAIYQASSSRFASYYHAKNKHKLVELIRKNTRFVSILTLAGCLFVAYASNFFLTLYGKAFIEAEPIMYILLVSVIINASAGPVGHLLIMTNNERHHFRAMVVGTIVQGMLLPIIVPRMGGVGAAIVVLISTLIWNVLMIECVHRRLSLNRILAWA